MSPLCLEAHVFLKQSISPHLHLYNSFFSSLLFLLSWGGPVVLSDPQGMIPMGQSEGLMHSSTEHRASGLLTTCQEIQELGFYCFPRESKAQNSSSDVWKGIYLLQAIRIETWASKKEERESIFLPPLSVNIRGIFARPLYPLCECPKLGDKSKERNNQ